MAILSDHDIKKEIELGELKINYIKDFHKQLQPASMDLRLSNDFKIFKINHNHIIDSHNSSFDDFTDDITVEDSKPFIIHPNEFVLASTFESVSLPPYLAGRVEGRSSVGRMGVTVHVTAGYIDPGFNGRITLEMSNIGKMPVALYPMQRICQIVFETTQTPARRPYGHPDRDSKYQNQTLPMNSKICEDYELRGS